MDMYIEPRLRLGPQSQFNSTVAGLADAARGVPRSHGSVAANSIRGSWGELHHVPLAGTLTLDIRPGAAAVTRDYRTSLRPVHT